MQTVSMDKWQRAQELEREYHKNDQWRRSPAFMEDTGRLFEWFGFEQDQFAECAIADIGAGTMLRTEWFRGCCIYSLDPIVDAQSSPGSSKCRIFVYGQDAESAVDNWLGQMDAVFCINVLDHCYDPAKVIENCIAYLAPGGILCLSVDICDTTDEMHPAVIMESEVDEMLSGLTIERKLRGLPNSPHYGRGEAVTWIVRN